MLFFIKNMCYNHSQTLKIHINYGTVWRYTTTLTNALSGTVTHLQIDFFIIHCQNHLLRVIIGVSSKLDRSLAYAINK